LLSQYTELFLLGVLFGFDLLVLVEILFVCLGDEWPQQVQDLSDSFVLAQFTFRF
jgi:hypothetical protein